MGGLARKCLLAACLSAKLLVVRWLYLLRHAKSSWDTPELADIDRPLAGRGRHDAEAVAAHLHEQGIVPALVLCSPARRTRQTLKPLKQWITDSRIVFDDALYAAPADQLLSSVRGIDDEVASALLIDHEPGIRELALLLAESGEEKALARVQEKFPTGALAALTIPSDRWNTLEPGDAELHWFVTPKDL
jgi:phosphohistidine phosphatase